MTIASQAAKRIINIGDVPLKGRVVHFRYYESLLSPFISANFEYIDTGNTTVSDSKSDPQQRLGTLTSALPLRGNEIAQFKFTTSLGDLDLMRNPLMVDGAQIISQESSKEAVHIRLISKTYLENKNSRVEEKYYGNVSNSVSKIVKEKLRVQPNKIKVDPTRTAYDFTGSNQPPFELILELASLSTPPEGDPGYFFYETKSGLNFRSIDSLVSQKPKATYTYTGAFKSDIKNDSNAFSILEPPNKKDQSISSSLRAGMYSAKFRFMYEDEQVCRERVYKLDEAKQSTLGRKVEFDSALKSNPSRMYTLLVPTGMMNKKVGNDKNNDPADYLARSVMRYNLLFVQAMNIVVPCNPNLEAGDVIKCEFEKITTSNKSLGGTDRNQSGNYLILNLCHYYGSTSSYTYLTLVRDTYGEKGAVS